MTLFDRAFRASMLHEVGRSAWMLRTGGLTRDRDDPGGTTKWGISLRWASRALDMTEETLVNLTKAQAKAIYFRHWWQLSPTNRIPYDQIEPDRVAIKLYDTAINVGCNRAIKILQCALGVRADGIFGHRTLTAVNVMDEDYVLNRFVAEQQAFYQGLIDHKPSFAKYRKGWFRRACWLP
jgi:lysozyme family protein